MEKSALPKPDTAQPEVSQCKELDHRKEASEETFRDKTEASLGKLTNVDGTTMEERVKYVEDKLMEMNAQFEGAEKRLQILQERLSQETASGIDSCGSTSQEATDPSERVAQNSGIGVNAMRSHKLSDSINDPCQESSVLDMYDRLKTHEWEKAKCAASDSAFTMTYEKSRTIIKAVFDKCEEDLSQKMHPIFELLEIPISNETTSLFDSEQLPLGLVREIKNHFKNLYLSYGEDIYQSKSQPALSPDLQTFQPLVKFAAECYKIYCLMLLQHPPVRAMWHKDERIPTACIEHVDKKDLEDRMPLNFLWPLLARGRKVLRKGVAYD